MNAAILNEDLPISLRLKRANKRKWRLDDQRLNTLQNTAMRVHAYRQYAAPLPWEATYAENRNYQYPSNSFGSQAVDLAYEVFGLDGQLELLDDEDDYPGIGNRKAQLHNAIKKIEKMQDIRAEEEVMMGFTKSALLKAIERAREKQMSGYDELPRFTDMRSSQFSKDALVIEMAETLNLTSDVVSQLVLEADATPTRQTRFFARRPTPGLVDRFTRPGQRSSSPTGVRRSPKRSPQTTPSPNATPEHSADPLPTVTEDSGSSSMVNTQYGSFL